VISSEGYVHNNGDTTHAYRILDMFITLKTIFKETRQRMDSPITKQKQVTEFCEHCNKMSVFIITAKFFNSSGMICFSWVMAPCS
jgi:hypothetical protein